jgi:hypothetical protein
MTVDTNTGLLTYSTYEVDTLDIPTTGAPIPITNYLIVKQIQDSPPLRQIISRVVWTFSLTGQPFTNTIVTLRAPDQFQ